MELPHALHRATPAELKQRLEAARRGTPFLLYRDADGAQQIADLAAAPEQLTIGRSAANWLALPWDRQISRVHVRLERVGGQWTLVDDGIARNGSFIDGVRLQGRRRLDDGCAIALGQTIIVFRKPAERESIRTETAEHAPSPTLSAAQRRVLGALCRPCQESPLAAPASNRQIADELIVGIETVKTHMRALFAAFGLEGEAPAGKRLELARRALQTGAVPARFSRS